MSPEAEKEVVALLTEIRDGQRDIVAQLTAQRAAAEAQLRRSQERVEESVGLQREALRRQRVLTSIAIPGVIACIVAIGYLVLRYF